MDPNGITAPAGTLNAAGISLVIVKCHISEKAT
jgi:hypothetical protein